MGRELRRVPKDWQHPDHAFMYDKSYEDAKRDWDAAKAKFDQGLDDDGEPLPNEALTCAFVEWHGDEPNPAYYRPNWSDEERTHFQMYETCSEGSPISPVLKSPEAVAKWCADNEASAFGDMTAPYEWWMKVCQGSAGFGLLINTQTKTSTPI